MLVICSYCRQSLGEKPPLKNKQRTHGMCRECNEALKAQLDGQSFDDYLGSFENPVVVVDSEGRVLAANSSACEMLDKPAKTIQGFLGGEAFECAYARLPGGCGNTSHCPTCSIRNLINTTIETKKDQNNIKVNLTTDAVDFEMIVSTHYKDGLVRIVILHLTPVN